MASYDFIECSVSAYKYAWRERVYLFKLALIPVLVKICCAVVVYALGMEEQYLRLGLVLLPAYFAEGVFLSRIVYEAGVLKGARLAGPLAAGSREGQILKAAVVLYVLVKLVSAFFGGIGAASFEIEKAEAAEPSPVLFIAAMAILAAMIWGVRLMWLYVPVALGYSIRDFLKRVRGIAISFYLIGTWLICFTPPALVLILAAGFLGDIFGGDPDAPSQLYSFTLIGVQSLLDMAAMTLASLAIAFGVQEIMTGKPERTADVNDEDFL